MMIRRCHITVSAMMAGGVLMPESLVLTSWQVCFSASSPATYLQNSMTQRRSAGYVQSCLDLGDGCWAGLWPRTMASCTSCCNGLYYLLCVDVHDIGSLCTNCLVHITKERSSHVQDHNQHGFEQ